MKVTYNWLKEYVEIKISPQALAEKLTMAGLEVISLEKFGEDWVFEVEVTTNRPDWLSVIGIAREIAAITGKKLKLPQIKGTKHQAPNTRFPLKIKIEDKKGCLRYIGRVIDNIEVKPSPDWLKKRLESVGLRPVNNIVDIANFCLLEWGQPLHAFDYDKIEKGEIIVRRAKDKEEITTIDGIERTLDKSILVIADARRPVAVAGIMGGRDTEVSEQTKTVLLESAYFDPVTIRKASQKLALVSASSYRFERRVGFEEAKFASLRAVDLVRELVCPKDTSLRTGPIKDVGVKKQKEKKIFLVPEKVGKFLGKEITSQEMRGILNRLSFEVKKKGKGFEVKVPLFRRDVEEEVDLIEEISRIYGYDKIPLTLAGSQEPGSAILEPRERRLKDSLRETLLSLGFNEIISYSLISQALLDKISFNIDEKVIKIKNPLSSEQEFLHPTLTANMLSTISWNVKRQMEDLKLFELGKVYTKEAGEVKEEPCLSIGLTGRRYLDWLRKIEPVDFYELKGIIESIFRKINIPEFTMVSKEKPYFSLGCSAEIKIKDKTVGFVGEVNKAILKNFDLTQKIFLAELNLEKIFSFVDSQKRYSPLPKYPFVNRDISFLVDEKINFGELAQFFEENRYGLIKEINLVDVYAGENIPSGKKSLTLSLKFQSAERTLRDEEINAIEAKIRQGLVEKFGVQLR